MKAFFFIFLFGTGMIFGQDTVSSSKFIQLTEVEQPPVFPGCESLEFEDCSLQKITSHLLDNLDNALLDSLTQEEALVYIRFVIDTEGKVLRTNLQSRNQELKTTGEIVLKDLPDFLAGMHGGEKVNVIVNIPLQIEKTGRPKLDRDLYDTPAIAKNCADREEPKICTGEMVQQFIFKNFQYDRFKTRGKMATAEISFIIDKEGKVTDISAEGDNDKLNKEAISIIKRLPDFIPATKDGEPIEFVIRLPIGIKTR